MTDLARYQPRPYVQIRHPEWTRSATIYQLNTRQFTAAGTLVAAAGELPRLRDLGVDIVWLMPIHPIGEVNRKGTLGSPYSVKDYYGVNPELGTLEDLRGFVDRAHTLGMHVILDWVANHTSWDNPLVERHPEWYARDWKGDFRPTPWWDWTDVIDLDYSHPGLRAWMTEALCWWVREVGVDGFRCDVAGFVPLDFWETAREELDAIKPVFMLAEWESRDLHARAFDASYAWGWWRAVTAIAAGRAHVHALYEHYSWVESSLAPEIMRMTHVTNHDRNAWDGTVHELLGDAADAAIVLSVVGDGIPLMYSGQEAGDPKRLDFFERDPIPWQSHPHEALYRRLFALKHEHPALHNAPWGARMVRVPSSDEHAVLAFVRRKEEDRVFALFNFTPAEKTVTLRGALHHGAWRDVFDGAAASFGPGDDPVTLPPWGYRVLVGRETG